MKYFLLTLLFIFSLSSLADDDSKAFSIKAIDTGVYLHKSYRTVEGFGRVSSNGLVVVENDEAYIIDTPWNEEDNETLITWISDKGYQLKGSVSTHSHDDRTAGIALLNAKSVPTFTSHLTHQILANKKQPTASNVFKQTPFWLKKGSIEVFYPGAGHTTDNVVVWLPKQQLLFGGCLVRSAGSRSLGYTGEASIKDWGNSIRAILTNYSEIKTVVPGHGPVGDTKMLSHTIDLAEAAETK